MNKLSIHAYLDTWDEGPVDEYLCLGVYDRYRSQPLSVGLKYSGFENAFAYWRFVTPYGFNASRFDDICFWVYSEIQHQEFEFGMKDLNWINYKIRLRTNLVDEWEEICVSLGNFYYTDIELYMIESIDLSFSQYSGNAMIWVDDFEFR